MPILKVTNLYRCYKKAYSITTVFSLCDSLLTRPDSVQESSGRGGRWQFRGEIEGEIENVAGGGNSVVSGIYQATFYNIMMIWGTLIS